MSWLASLNYGHLIVLGLVLTRVSGLMLSAPFFGAQEVPARIRAFLALAVALVLWPTQIDAPVPTPHNLIDLGLLVGGEVLIGLCLGLGLQVLFAGVQLAGVLISQVSGMSLADVFNPNTDSDVPLLSNLLFWFSLIIFLVIGGHRLVMGGLLGSFQTLPLGHVGLPRSFGEAVVVLMGQSLELGLRAAAPTVTALLLATLLLGLVSRTLPQLNIMAVGFGLNVLATLGTLALCLGSIAWLLQAYLDPFLETLLWSVGIEV